MTRRALPAALATALVIAGCRGQSLGGRSRFVEDGVTMAALTDWDGERIKIDTTGVSPSGGLALSAGDTSRVSSVARMLAVADTFDKPNADRAILSATKSYTIATSASVTTVTCGHGETFASAAGADSGCDALDVSVPLGTSSKRLSVDARSGNGKVVVSLDRAELAELTLSASHGIIDVTTAITQGAVITIASETGDDITLRVPTDFAADKIVIDTAADKIDTSDVGGLQPGSGRGAPGSGAKTITLRSGVAGGLRGRIAIVVE